MAAVTSCRVTAECWLPELQLQTSTSPAWRHSLASTSNASLVTRSSHNQESDSGEGVSTLPAQSATTAAKPNNTDTPHRTIMTDTLPDKDSGLDSVDLEEKMEDKQEDMFVSAMDSPSDSGLETQKTSNSDTMEDLSLQVGSGHYFPR